MPWCRYCGVLNTLALSDKMGVNLAMVHAARAIDPDQGVTITMA